MKKERVSLKDKIFSRSNACLVVAEAGSNHNGSAETGKQLIAAANKSGCDAVKFQAFKTENLVTKTAPKAPYQKGKSSGLNQFQMLKSLELSEKEHAGLVNYAKKIGIPLFYSVFDRDSADLVERLGVDIFKLGSGELTNIPLIEYIAGKNKPLILSCGMGTDEEIALALNSFRKRTSAGLMLMHCSTGYPSAQDEAHLARRRYLEEKFKVPCGISDHAQGLLVSVAAACLGSRLVEKHFTLDKRSAGPDHAMSIDPCSMQELCRLVHSVEKNPVSENNLLGCLRKLGIQATQAELEKILGSPRRKLSEAELGQRAWARKSLVASCDIKKGKKIALADLSVKRPEKGILPKDIGRVIEKKAKVSIKKETPILWEMLV